MGKRSWERGHGKEFMGKRLRERGNGKEFTGKRSWGRGCGTEVMRKRLWDRGHGKEVMGKRSWKKGHGKSKLLLQPCRYIFDNSYNDYFRPLQPAHGQVRYANHSEHVKSPVLYQRDLVHFTSVRCEGGDRTTGSRSTSSDL